MSACDDDAGVGGPARADAGARTSSQVEVGPVTTNCADVPCVTGPVTVTVGAPMTVTAPMVVAVTDAPARTAGAAIVARV